MRRSGCGRGWRKEVRLQLRHLERIALGTRHPEVAEGAVVDLLRRGLPGGEVMAVHITGGLKETEEGGYYGVPKRDLIIGLQVLMQRDLLWIARGMAHGADLEKELAAMEVRVTSSGREQYAAWREGAHDDLVFAVALACWCAQKADPKDLKGRPQWWTNRHEADAARLLRKR